MCVVSPATSVVQVGFGERGTLEKEEALELLVTTDGCVYNISHALTRGD